MKRLLITLVVGLASTACSDAPLAPLAPTSADRAAVAAPSLDRSAPAPASAALDDAADRLALSLGASADAADASDALRQIIVQRRGGDLAAERASQQRLAATLDRIERAQPEDAAEVDAIRLAVAAAAADRMHKPF
jgi:hypothetical protein